MSRLESRSLTGSRGPARLFRDVSFEASSGEWIALRGPNGSGKTTLLRCVAGLTRPDSGEVLWDGSAAGTSNGSFLDCLLYAGHLPGLKDDLSAEENLRSALALHGVAATEDATRSALADVGLTARSQLPARRLSAGQRRRIGLARLALDPATLWVLDEPLTALDDDGQRFFESLLTRHLGRGGLALIATHQPLAPSPAREIRMGA
jgi:heme exporter protein A